MKKSFLELRQLEKLITEYNSDQIRFKKLAEVQDFPIWSLSIGNQDPKAPILALIAGVHGLERVGSQVLISYLGSLMQQLSWDNHLKQLFSKVRLISIPILNPTGMNDYTRSNYNGVDLMRNSPIESTDSSLKPLVSGHRLSPKLPWYRGNGEMEVESKTLVEFMENEALKSEVCLSIDFHSGFGMKDRLWYPFAKSKEKFPDWDKVQKIKSILDRTYPHHIYQIESQSDSYTTHGDLWDYIYEIHQNKYSQNTFIPWTLEMGSWIWVKKNPLQIITPDGLFNPIKKHRADRVMRRHLYLIDFFLRSVNNSTKWR